MSAVRHLYTALVYALLPRARWHLARRARRQPEYREHIPERFGRDYPSAGERPLIWIHAVSVGETRAAQPLIQALMERYPAHRILLTHMTPTGRATGRELFGDRVLQCYLPYDYPAAMRRFFDHYRPQVGVIMETEIWPNLLHEARQRGLPVFLVNARLSERSYRGYHRFRPLVTPALDDFAEIAAQTTADAERFRALGATRVRVTGTIKFDVTPAPGLIDRGHAWREQFARRRVLLAASTRDGEEALVLDAWLELADSTSLLMIVPRHPQRFDEVAELLQQRGVAFQRRSTNEGLRPDTRVLLGDSMGEMVAYYAASDLAFIGGSLARLGGQNLIEAMAVGVPVLIGPHTYNFEEVTDQAIVAGAALRVADAAALREASADLLAAPERLATMRERALAFAAAHRGATRQLVDLIKLSGDQLPRSSH